MLLANMSLKHGGFEKWSPNTNTKGVTPIRGFMGYFGVCRYLVLDLIPIDVIDGNLTLENDIMHSEPGGWNDYITISIRETPNILLVDTGTVYLELVAFGNSDQHHPKIHLSCWWCYESASPFGHFIYPLVMTNIAIERSIIFNGKIHYFYIEIIVDLPIKNGDFP